MLVRNVLFVALLLTLPVSPSSAQIASAPVKIESSSEGNWLQKKIDAKLASYDKKANQKIDYRWKFKPGIAFRMGRKGIDMAIGPRIGVARRTSRVGQISMNASYLPFVFADLKSGSKIEYTRFDIGYRHFLSDKMFVGTSFSIHKFSPSGEFREEIADRGGSIDKKTINSQSVSFGHQIFKVAWSYRGRKRVWPFFSELTYQFADDYKYGADIGRAGTEYPIRSGLSFRIRPLLKQF